MVGLSALSRAYDDYIPVSSMPEILDIDSMKPKAFSGGLLLCWRKCRWW
jgi:hypothetical protein